MNIKLHPPDPNDPLSKGVVVRLIAENVIYIEVPERELEWRPGRPIPEADIRRTPAGE